MATLSGHSRNYVVPRLLTPHPHLERPEAGSAAFQREVQQVGGWLACDGACEGTRSRDLDRRCLQDRPCCSSDGDGQRKVLKLQPFRSVLDPICGQGHFLSYNLVGMVQEIN